jgi:hypothetical protein
MRILLVEMAGMINPGWTQLGQLEEQLAKEN